MLTKYSITFVEHSDRFEEKGNITQNIVKVESNNIVELLSKFMVSFGTYHQQQIDKLMERINHAPWSDKNDDIPF